MIMLFPVPVGFQHTTARRRLRSSELALSIRLLWFQHTTARRRLQVECSIFHYMILSFNTQPPEGGCKKNGLQKYIILMFQHTTARRRLPVSGMASQPLASSFNTQPPEGGCAMLGVVRQVDGLFQHTTARRRLPTNKMYFSFFVKFQHTTARRRLRSPRLSPGMLASVSTHNRPKAAAFQCTTL